MRQQLSSPIDGVAKRQGRLKAEIGAKHGRRCPSNMDRDDAHDVFLCGFRPQWGQHLVNLPGRFSLSAGNEPGSIISIHEWSEFGDGGQRQLAVGERRQQFRPFNRRARRMYSPVGLVLAELQTPNAIVEGGRIAGRLRNFPHVGFREP